MELQAAAAAKAAVEAELKITKERLARALDSLKSLEEASASAEAAQQSGLRRIAELQEAVAASEGKAAEVCVQLCRNAVATIQTD